MASNAPAVELFSTSILSNVKVRTRHERYVSVLGIKKIPYIYHDLASDDEAKSRWRRKAKDQQLPGLLVHNEWVGGFDEFEESVEFGELELFLGVSAAPAQQQEVHPAQLATTSKDASLYPTMNFAPEGSGRRAEPTADDFLATLGLTDKDVNDADIDALLAGVDSSQPKPPPVAELKQKYYVPSEQAAIMPLRFAKMGSAISTRSGNSSTDEPARAPPVARYSDTSAKELAAEAAALTSNRKTSGSVLREAVAQGKSLDEAMSVSQIRNIVAHDDLDDLFASLGLQDVDIDDTEVDEFLAKGAIPQKLQTGQGLKTTKTTTRPESTAEVVAATAVDTKPSSIKASLKSRHSDKVDPAAIAASVSSLDKSVDASDSVASITAPLKQAEDESSASTDLKSSKSVEIPDIAADSGKEAKADVDSSTQDVHSVSEDAKIAAISSTDSKSSKLDASKDLKHDEVANTEPQLESIPTPPAQIETEVVEPEHSADAIPAATQTTDTDKTEAPIAQPLEKVPSTDSITEPPALVLPNGANDEELHPSLGDDAFLALQYALRQEQASPSASPSRLAAMSPKNGSTSPQATTPTAAMSRSPSSTSPRDGTSPRVSPSARKAIDVSRPINPDLDAANTSASETPVKKKRGMSIGGFRIGKDKEPVPDTPTLTKPTSPAVKAEPSPKPTSARHERTISEILRDADAVLGMDDDDEDADLNGGGPADEDDYHGIFGSSGDTAYSTTAQAR